jgi:hypothetical protein
MRGHYPIAHGDPLGYVLGAILCVVIVLAVGAFVWFLVGAHFDD